MPRFLVAALVMLVFAPSAWAGTTYYAAPLTANTTGCDQANPCTLVAAVGKAASGDTVQLEPGEYHRGGGAGTDLGINAGITLQGQPGAARPRIVQEDPYTSCVCSILSSSNGNVTFRHLFLDQSVDSAGGGGLQLHGSDVVEDVLSVGGHYGGYSVTGVSGATEVRNSVFIGGNTGFDAQTSLHLQHVTMVANDATGTGLTAERYVGGTTAATVDNSILQGGASGHDVVAITHDASSGVVVTGHYSAMSRSAGDSGGTGTEQFDLSDHVLADDPVFTDGGFGVTGASKTIDAADRKSVV